MLKPVQRLFRKTSQASLQNPQDLVKLPQANLRIQLRKLLRNKKKLKQKRAKKHPRRRSGASVMIARDS